MRTLDLVIVGAGPAGLATALSLLELDPEWRHRLVVLEKKTHPRHKLCGGGLTPYALRHLRRLGLRLDIPFVPVDHIQFEYAGRSTSLPGDPAIVITRRAEFDHWLAQETKGKGVEILEGTGVIGLHRRKDGILLETDDGQFLAHAVVGADGSRGIVRRWLDARENPPHVARLLETVTPASGREPEYQDRFARFDFTPTLDALQGYYWDFPSLIGGIPFMNRGVYDGRVSAGKPRASLPRLLKEYAREHGAEPEDIELEGHPIHWFSPRNRFSADRVLLVGDAAGAEPLFGEGIGPALGHGQVAAIVLHRAFQRQRFGFQGYRWRLILSSVGGYLLIRWAIAHTTYLLSGLPASGRALWWLARLGLRFISLPQVPGVLAPPQEPRVPQEL